MSLLEGSSLFDQLKQRQQTVNNRNSPYKNHEKKNEKQNIAKSICTKMMNGTNKNTLVLVITLLLIAPYVGLFILLHSSLNDIIAEQHLNDNLIIVDPQLHITLADWKRQLFNLQDEYAKLQLKEKNLRESSERLEGELEYFNESEEEEWEEEEDADVWDEEDEGEEEADMEEHDIKGRQDDDWGKWDANGNLVEVEVDADENENVGKEEDDDKHRGMEFQKGVQTVKLIKQKMQKAAQKESKVALLNQFGPGPHHVEIQLDFDPAENEAPTSDPAPDRFVIEMADVDEMPHTVYWFLQQVDHKLWNGCSFHRNAGHVLQAGPEANFKTPSKGAHLLDKFIQSGLESVLFQEYSPEFPHEKYTLGLAGRPGGADFYINKRDNTKAHGPGGQTSYDDPTEADPCFAKVISGFDTIDRMSRLSVEDDDYEGLNHNVAIRYMKITQRLDDQKKAKQPKKRKKK